MEQKKKRWIRSRYTPVLPLGEDGRLVTGCEKHIALSKTAAEEGMVLLKNDSLLPLAQGTKLAIFGTNQIDYVKGGGGSGDVHTRYVRNLYDGLKIKESEGKIQVFDELSAFYQTCAATQDESIPAYYSEDTASLSENETAPDGTIHRKIPADLLDRAKAFTDTAVITVGRYSQEAADRTSEKGDFYLSDDEAEMINTVCANFSRVIAVINAGGMMDTEWFCENDKISAALWIWNAGMEGGLAAANILCGDVNPSGKLADTLVKSFDDYPSSASFNESNDYVKYYDDIYVGYRYFETVPGAAEKVNYCFGFGLSYTSFAISDAKATDNGETITVTATVTNTGTVPGKEVVQVYYSAPQGKLGKPKRELAGYRKTKLLSPNESEAIAITFAISDMASYDDLGKCAKSSYILEQGDYEIYLGNSVRDTVKLDYVYTVTESYRITEQLAERCEPYRLEKRMLSDGSYEELPLGKYKKEFVYQVPPENPAEAPDEPISFFDVADGKASMDAFLAQLSDAELCGLLAGTETGRSELGYKRWFCTMDAGCTGVANTAGIGYLPKYEVPPVMTADGPAGLRVREESGIKTTAWPCATLLACTWNPDLLEKIGSCGASEVKENNMGIWLTPGMNIHRTPLCGRNFEYFSEDPYLTGTMAAAKVKGIQSQGIAATIKHFACNNKEVNRKRADSIVSERALREIYLKGFEICVKTAKPWLLMTSYNKLNGHHTSANYDLITEILRGEWGYDGAVTTDWRTYGGHTNDVKAGNDIKMPRGYMDELEEAITWNAIFPRSQAEACAKRVLELILKIDC